jgi:5-methylcytosine-specific restriction endonuclease McrA
MNIGFECINPVPQYPAGITQALLNAFPWNSRKQIVTSFKLELKASLRTVQHGRCCFCRRLLYDDYAAHLEHFVDQSTHPDHRYEIRNLALSCGTCNVKKNGYFSTWVARYRRLTKNPGATRTPVLSIHLNPGAHFPINSAEFRWVNPYVHKYSDHIVLAHGWVFIGRSATGQRTVRGLRLNELEEVERRALTERLEMRGGLLSMLVASLAELDQHRARDIARVVAAGIARRRNATT